MLRKDKEIWTENEEGLPVLLYEAKNEKDEAEFIIREIEAMLKDPNSGIKDLKDFVVLYRTNAQSRALEETFLKYNLPYKIVGGLRFYERKEIKDMIAFLRAIYNPTDTFAVERIINIPPRGITPPTWEKIAQIWKKKAADLEKLKKTISKMESLNPRAKKAVSHFIDLLSVFNEAVQKLNPVELIDFVLKGVDYKEYILDGTIEGETRWENIQELKSVAENFVQFPPTDGLAAFLEEVTLVSEIDEWDPEVSAVTLMTAHNAKGLEFGCVFMVGMEEGLFPHSRSLMEPTELEEERRLCYVGMTRAKKRLYLIYAKSRLLYGGIQVNMKSRFLDDIPSELSLVTSEQKIVYSKNRKPLLTKHQILKTPFKTGDKVSHPKFGQGIVVEVRGDVLKVAFAGLGIKKLSASIAPLTKI
jgi:DNA helicase-2/ATP-dependent DNA helicase PcrA